MNNTEIADINPKVLAWAIARRGLDYHELSEKSGVAASAIRAGAEGRFDISFDAAIDLAEVLRVPLGYFYLAEIPVIETPIPDLRTLPFLQSKPPTADFLDVLHAAMAAHEWYKEYLLELGAKKLKFVSKFARSNSVEDVAQDICHTLGIDSTIRNGLYAPAELLSSLVHKAENAGILVMRRGIVGVNTHRPLQVEEFQGFAISDPIVPLVFINAQDYDAARVFTLIHEIAHIWIGASGISADTELQTTGKKPELELFCNSIAAEVLVPRRDFARRWAERYDLEEMQSIATHFLVSVFVILRRAYELKLISDHTFRSLRAEAQQGIKPKKKSLGGNSNQNLNVRHGAKLVEAVFDEVRSERTSYREGASLLGMGLDSFIRKVEGKSSP